MVCHLSQVKLDKFLQDRFLQATASRNVFTCKFNMNQLYVDFLTKGSSIIIKESFAILQSWTSGIYYKVGQILQSVATFIAKRGTYYKAGQLLQNSAVQKTSGRNGKG